MHTPADLILSIKREASPAAVAFVALPRASSFVASNPHTALARAPDSTLQHNGTSTCQDDILLLGEVLGPEANLGSVGASERGRKRLEDDVQRRDLGRDHGAVGITSQEENWGCWWRNSRERSIARWAQRVWRRTEYI